MPIDYFIVPASSQQIIELSVKVDAILSELKGIRAAVCYHMWQPCGVDEWRCQNCGMKERR
jgi:hypothetical protein